MAGRHAASAAVESSCPLDQLCPDMLGVLEMNGLAFGIMYSTASIVVSSGTCFL